MGTYETLSHISAYEILAAFGAFCELAGFLWVVAGVSQALSEQYDEHDWPHRLWFGIRHVLSYVFEEAPKPVSLAGSFSATSGATATVTGRKIPESDIEKLGRELRELRSEVEQNKRVADERFAAVETSHRVLSETLNQRTDALEQRLTEIHRSSLRKEKGGALLFMFGTLLTLVAVLI
jgi:hypothetical protein